MPNNKLLSAENSLEEVLRQLGVTRLYKGHAYLVSAVKLVQEGSVIGKPLYQIIAEQHRAKRQNVYTDMRGCVRRAQSVNPLFLSMVMFDTTEGQLSLLPRFIQSVAVWVERHEAILVFDDKSSFGKIIWNERLSTEAPPEPH